MASTKPEDPLNNFDDLMKELDLGDSKTKSSQEREEGVVWQLQSLPVIGGVRDIFAGSLPLYACVCTCLTSGGLGHSI